MNTIHDHAVRILADTVAFRPVPHCTTGIGSYVRHCEQEYYGFILLGALIVLAFIALLAGVWKDNK